VQVWSPSMHALTGLPTALATGRPLGELLPCRPVETSDQARAAGTDEAAEMPDLMDVTSLGLTSESPRRTVELALRRPDGEERWVRMSHNAVFEADNLTQDV